MIKDSDQLTIQSSLEALKIIRNFVYEFCKRNKIVEKSINSIVLAVDEATTNIVKHAYKNKENGIIYISLTLRDNVLSIELEDLGVKFNENDIPKANIEDYYKEHKKGGWGVFLIKKLMDLVHYTRSDEGKNYLLLEKKVEFEEDAK
ncbi:MAG TPA: ATP-binding protein [Ignavibacteriales bacterium]|nr:ATP-binding protein [Ignavibacteriales bacterium]HOL80966.1 ATP-binding protein [Ignavibacteriales bacterium]HOM64701.1 ATP-binding protein [Ignavibacteriales bacterium]HPD66767.1 ATP-binding protein [Ignavibacteriales bacterium]HPP32746.1 ATP-binding protein [Ignavibacteriales bacterium]